ncbi:MAG: folK [Gammaproteobacteria bacterium]|nr:folK [Gammaproteobacteria bacterium]
MGSNLNNPIAQVQQAIVAIKNFPKTCLLTQSSLYLTKPLGPQDQNNFINAVLKIETNLEPQALLKACQELELKQGRIKTRYWGERTLDVDILLYSNEIIDLPELKIPHPGLKQRDFVLLPLAEIEPDLVLPSAESIKDLLKVPLMFSIINKIS